MPTLLAFGNSQIGPFLNGHRSLRAKGQLTCDVRGLTFAGERYNPQYIFESEGGVRFNPRMIEDTIEVVRKEQPVAVVSAVLGSDHWRDGVIHHARPYDFLVPSLPEHKKAPGTELIPYDLLARRIHGDLDWQFDIVRAIRAFCDLPIYIIEAPPPVQSAEMMLRSVYGHFQEAMEEFGCPDVSFRYKIWWLYLTLTRQFCGDLGFEFVEGPPQTRDERGFLREVYYLDGVHGTDAYGELMALEVARKMQSTAMMRV